MAGTERVLKGGKKKLRKVAGTERVRVAGSLYPIPPPSPYPSSSPIQAEMAEMSNPGIEVSRNGQFAVK